MLLIGDIHINTVHKEKILTSLRNFIASQPEEKNLIFLGDFVYHFSYDRNALLALYDLFFLFCKKVFYKIPGGLSGNPYR